MIIFLISAIVLIIGMLFCRSDPDSIVGMFFTIVGGSVLIVALVFLFLSPQIIKAEIVKFESIGNTIMVARETGNELEKAAIQNKIISNNAWLAGKKYWNETIFGIFIPDEIMQLKPLR